MRQKLPNKWNACATGKRSVLHELTEGFYLAAGLAAWIAIALPAPRLSRLALVLLGVGALAHTASLATLHQIEPVPSLTHLPAALSVSALTGVIFFFVLLMMRVRIAGFVSLVAPIAYLSVFIADVRLTPPAPRNAILEVGSWPHAHVLLSSGGLALLGFAGMAGVLFLAEHRRLKAKRSAPGRFPLPSLEALDRANIVALAAGLPLLTLGVVTGVLWVDDATGQYWRGSAHEIWMIAAWVIYAALAGARFGGGQAGRSAALSAVIGFAFLFLALVGVEVGS